MSNKPRIGFLTTTDPRDKRSWSGIHTAMLEELQKEYTDIVVLGPFNGGFPQWWGRVKNKVLFLLFRKRFDYSHSRALSKHYAALLKSRIASQQPDILIAPSASAIIAESEFNVPCILLSDTTLARMLDYYTAYSQLSSSSRKQSLQTENKAIAKSRFCVFPSQWAAHSAVADHHATPEKIKIVPFGANFRTFPSREEALAERGDETLKLLFLGVEWIRKGGPLVLETFHLLQKMGIPTQLTIVGCTPQMESDPDIQIIPFINKNDPKGEESLRKLFLSHHFLFLPSEAECYGIVFCEASSCGTPSITRDTGGIEGAVKNGINGYRLPEKAEAKDYAEKISRLFRDKDMYRKLQFRSRDLFEDSHNWKSWLEDMKKLITSALQQ